MRAYHIYLLRHGQTQGNRDGRYVGKTDLPLSSEGEAELREMLGQYEYPKADIYYSSPMQRCTSTLSVLYPGESFQLVDDLRECDFGDFEGKTIAELKDHPDYAEWASGTGRAAPPNGESSVEFQKRSCAAFERIVDHLMRSGKSSAVIMAHGGTIMSVLGRYAFPRRAFYEWMTKNATGYEVLVTPQLWMSARALEVAGGIPFVRDESAGTEDEE